ncbi:hypothetical protein OIDMADRAFT_99766 [Oidiodendron maius Zn]|uniref:Amidohydrolase 3 domain-containing protein n=1 Tax=Oidiodendron maius (strain Zn) TaxID=913774 RepID=A0A0C3E075_OIDMZ|nr:hypothetical protein OIDMADRAFT_99766 [Oidiodendron maius Zn]
MESQTGSSLYCVPKDSPFFISTLNPAVSHAKCFRFQQGLFTDVLENHPTSNENEILLLNGYVLPGIIESHGHILQYGEMLESVSLFGTRSIDDVRTRIKDFLKTHKGEGYGTREKWIRGVGWDQTHFGGVMPTAKELGQDPTLTNLYIMLDRVDVHCVWTSQKVLDLLPDPLPDAPPGGVVVTDPGLGVFCDNAMDSIIFPYAPKPNVEQKSRWVETAMSELNKVGIVGVGDAGMRPDDIAILELMAENQQLTIRINVMVECKKRNTFCPKELQGMKLLNAPNGLRNQMLLLHGVKLFADGALGSWGAAMIEPYSDKPDISGTMLINETALTTVVSDHPDDQARIARMGIIPSIQPTHATSDMAYALSRLGPERLGHSAYRMASYFPTHKDPNGYPGPVLGSDFPVEPPNPFHGMYAAVARLDPATGTSPSGEGGWYPQEAITVEQALLGFTRNAAYGWFRENVTGAIEVGKWADFIVVDKDVWKDETGEALRDVHVTETWVGGRKVYTRREAKGENSPQQTLIMALQKLLSWATSYTMRDADQEL